ncbi:putative extracellular sulfatase Sulf-1 homolog [Mya arenaria]|uniref:putative extracellular sulfatase Sulf-1 homolog n=1 Tax=Mya arenaria TaxID=6604 RepID=UPI0022E0B3CB|nr:putative extracellular sulfatase Sulf-1 homolog [Mya arenaria]XP_052764187.1 putative extracellular sulfatase Sulf-1 homolog [Mya arenaria]XP_052764188.1 putative extracellular sulfatase Sulf-1 homolog [Mya arenaria]
MVMTQLQSKLVLFGFFVILYLTFTLEAAKDKDSERNFEDLNDRISRSLRRSNRDNQRNNRRFQSQQRGGAWEQRSEKPNIILIITDDQDEMLGSMTTMTKTLKIMGQEGIHFNNSFVSTPMCCPSRSSLLTGLFPHNHHVYTNNDNCSGTEWQREHEPRTFAKYLSDAGYRTGFFGKYLNEYNGTYIPPGWREWVGLVKNSRFYNYTLNFNGQKVRHDDNYYQDYFTDLIGNDSITFLKQSKQYFPTKPVMMMLSVPAPHGPEDSAPQYQHMFENNTLHRTPSWNYMNNSDKQWLLQEMKTLDPTGIAFTDMLQRKRLQTLQSVDSLVEKVYYQLRLLRELDNTYIIYTSDHGYHLGQFGIAKGKALPYDFDIRVPLYIRGPGILRDTKIPNAVGNVDIAPTILDMAGLEVPEHMDGRSLLKLIKDHKQENNVEGRFVKPRRPWRDTVLIERGKVTVKMLKGIFKAQDEKLLSEQGEVLMPFVDQKTRKTMRICADPENAPPCKYEQKWVCFKDHRDRNRIKKCRNYNRTIIATNDHIFQKDEGFSVPLHAQNLPTTHDKNPKCNCSQKYGNAEGRGMPYKDQELQRQFSRNHMSSTNFKPTFFRKKRSLYDEELSLKKKLIAQQLTMNRQRCRYLPNNTFTCDKELVRDPAEFEHHQHQLDKMIEETRKRLRNLKRIRKQMKKQRRLTYEDKNDSDEFDYADNDDTIDYDESFSLDHTDSVDLGREEEEQEEDDGCDCDVEIDELDELRKFGADSLEEYVDEFGNSMEEDDDQEGQFRKKGKKSSCNHDNLKCSIHDNDHWQTPPRWTLGPYCFCTNAEKNTYWCLRTVNETHNFLYCEFVDSFLAFYDFTTDPHQLHNVIKSVDFGVMEQLHEELVMLRRCQGGKQCNKIREKGENKRRRRRRKVRRGHRNRSRRHNTRTYI